MTNNDIAIFIQNLFPSKGVVALHEPCFYGNEKEYVLNTIESTFVSSIGEYVTKFENLIQSYTKSHRVVATVNGTSALHIALKLKEISSGDLVITQPLTFVATCNAISYLGAEPVFLDIDRETLGLSPISVSNWLKENALLNSNSQCIHKESGRKIKALLPMHTFGHPAKIDELKLIAQEWNLALIEDAAEGLGSFFHENHVGTFGDIGVISFNGNKIITSGGGGAILCSNKLLGDQAKHLTSTAKTDHRYEFFHDSVGYNYRMPNINAALGVAQFEKIDDKLNKKRVLASKYNDFFKDSVYSFISEPAGAKSNYWLNSIICKNINSKEELINYLNEKNIMARPTWKLMYKLPMYLDCIRSKCLVAEELESHVVSLPSSENFDL
jgi:aminotransferase in exopolysaccharide biosynthesis